MAKLPKPKHDYLLNYRVKEKSGNWGNWRIAFGQWIGIEHIQAQIKMLIRAYPRDIEIEFKMDGRLLDHNGDEIGKSMIFKKR